MSKEESKITIIGIVFIVIMGLYIGFNQAKDFTIDIVNNICSFAKCANIVSIQGSGDGILTNVFGHAVTFISVGLIIKSVLPKIKGIELIVKGLYFFIKIIVNNILNIINTLIFK